MGMMQDGWRLKCVGWAMAALLLALLPHAAAAQEADSTRATASDTTEVLPDAIRLADSTAARQALTPAPRPQASGDGLKEPVTFSARDSLVIVFGEEGDQGSLVGNAAVNYGRAKLEAHTIDILFEIDELRARGLPVDTGIVGLPTFTEGESPFTGLQLAYNLRTERGRVVEARTSIEDGFITAGVAKVTEDSTLYILDGAYTTCECDIGETPSYSLRARRMKIVDQEHVYTGPIRLYLFNIPTILWLPFGYLPAKEGRRSGPLAPQYGEDVRGFYLRGWGWYQAINEYMDLQVRAGLWSKGSWQINPIYRYNQRYRYSGQLSVDYLRELSGERSDPDLQVQRRASLRWQHRQTLNPTANFNANLDLTSSGYLRTVSEQYNDNVRQTVSSNLSYNKQWPRGGRSLSLTARQTQVLATGETDLTLPSLTFNQSRRTPFKRDRRAPGQDERWYERLTVSYTGSLTNQFRFDPLSDEQLIAAGDSAATDISWYDALLHPSQYRRATGRADTPLDLEASHRVPISAPFSINRIPLINRSLLLNVTPNATYTEHWFLETERQRVDSTNRVVRDPETGFFALRQFNAGVSANSTIYGIFPVGVGPYQGLRHTLRPTVALTFTPDFNSDFWGYTRTYTDTAGVAHAYDIVRGVNREQRSISFRLDNVFETRRVATDTTRQRGQNRTLKLFNVDLSSSYNFAADSLKLAPIQVSSRTRILNRLGLNFSATYSPYATDSLGRTVDRYVFSPGGLRLARLTDLRLSSDFSIRGGGSGGTLGTSTLGTFQPGTPDFGAANPFGGQQPFSQTDYSTANQYTDFSIPWSLNTSLTYNLSRFGTTSQRTLTLNMRFDFALTPKWRIQGNSGYDFERGELVTTRLYIVRDFECWEMSFNWVPFGDFQQYGFDLHVKSGKLRELLRIQQPRADVRDRFGNAL